MFKKIFGWRTRRKLRIAAMVIGLILLATPVVGVALEIMSHLLAVGLVLAGAFLIGELWNYKFDNHQD